MPGVNELESVERVVLPGERVALLGADQRVQWYFSNATSEPVRVLVNPEKPRVVEVTP